MDDLTAEGAEDTEEEKREMNNIKKAIVKMVQLAIPGKTQKSIKKGF
jgi:hypothetical protein